MVVVGSSIHPKSGDIYKWYDPEGNETEDIPTPFELAEIPKKWLIAFLQGNEPVEKEEPKAKSKSKKKTPDDFDKFCAEHSDPREFIPELVRLPDTPNDEYYEHWRHKAQTSPDGVKGISRNKSNRYGIESATLADLLGLECLGSKAKPTTYDILDLAVAAEGNKPTKLNRLSYLRSRGLLSDDWKGEILPFVEYDDEFLAACIDAVGYNVRYNMRSAKMEVRNGTDDTWLPITDRLEERVFMDIQTKLRMIVSSESRF